MATKIITAFFTNDGVPQPGLTPTITIYQLNTNSNDPIVVDAPVAEIGNGWYRYNFSTYNPLTSYVFTFDGGVTLDENDRYKYGGNDSYVEDIAPAVWDEQAVEHTIPGSAGLELNQISANVASMMITEVMIVTLLETLLKYERNRTEIDVANATLTIYDDDCTTPLTVFDLKDFHGMPSVQEVCERVPRGGNC